MMLTYIHADQLCPSVLIADITTETRPKTNTIKASTVPSKT